MSIHVCLNHRTEYAYERAIALGPQVVRLRPAAHSRTRILSYSLRVTPETHFINWQQDPHGNWLARLVFPEKTKRFAIEVDVVAEMAVLNPFDFFLEPGVEKYPFAYEKGLRHDLLPFLEKEPATPKFAEYLAEVPRKAERTIDFLVALNQRLCTDIGYLIRLEPGVQTPEETLVKASGSCRDSAWLLVQLLRHLGLAARFVSGYLIQLKADVKSLDGPSGTEVDFTDLHAWCEVYLPGAGWIGFDPTSGLLAGEGHIPLACSPEPSSAAPVSGVVEPCKSELEHHMSVTRVWEAPRVTKPYTPEQWEAIAALGHAVDERLVAADARLTMGGEPTFISIDDPDGAEWNTAALGPTKRKRAAELFHRMRDHYAPMGLAHFGQGKWYPGEQLPRWSLNCFWRRDGQPLWADPALYANEAKPSGADAALAGAFLKALAKRLGIDAKHVFPAFEDAFYYLWRERQLPINVDPLDSRLEDKLERARLAKVFSQGLEAEVGHVLPIARDGEHWRSGSWFLRAERCYLHPGDSPVGYRLPIDSQPWVKEGDYPWLHTQDPFEARLPLPAHSTLRHQYAASQGHGTALDARRRPAVRGDTQWAAAEAAPRAGESAASITRTAMCAEARNGTLYLFMPPLPTADDYLELVAAIDATAKSLAAPVLLEGYEPPKDPRLASFRVTPDPGVIEVNIQPAASWEALSEQTTFLYEAARESRLTSEKFMIDGRHTGTGGGNHFVLGGATPADSPFLRRPDLLRSLISYWHNHPSLSYLFSGLFIGPTSQAPRVDEARNDALYELELAFKQLPKQGESAPPWLVDRVLRNLLVDVTGNTHRAEFCIDKLYSPDSSTGRLGLLEMRAFEMPPHAQMSLSQQLLLRALVARFWEKPYAPPKLVRWGTELHDRFLLPHFVWQDFGDVIDDLRGSGYDFERDWFAPHLGFRFPFVGDFEARGASIEIRQALEPWHVMGEEGAAGGAVRYVDSSVERVQVKADGLSADRYILTCNGVPIPLQPTGTVGEWVAGVRYRAWQPESCLHPTIGVHAPLTFDLYDTWTQRALGGCRMHVAHPGGRNYVTFPVNAFEAESRRLARFFRHGHTPAGYMPAAPSVNAEHPFTLDLRRP